MMNHIAVFQFKEGTTEEQIDQITAALMEMGSNIGVLVDYRVGPDLGLVEGTWDFGVVAALEEADYPAYRDDPEHVSILKDLIKPVLGNAARVQIAV